MTSALRAAESAPRSNAKPHATSDASAALLTLGVLANGASDGLAAYRSWKEALRALVARDPLDAMVVTVLGGALLFYVAEKGRNPKVQTYLDALVFVSTCASVGYANVFACTEAGKAIASAVMTFGPSLSGGVFERAAGVPPRVHGAEPAPAAAVGAVIVEKLDAILAELRAGRSGGRPV